MKKWLKILFVFLLAITVIPVLFFGKGSAMEFPVATPDNAEVSNLSDIDFGSQDLLDWDFYSEVLSGSSDLGRIGQVQFNMKFEVQFIDAFLDANEQGILTPENFTPSEINAIYHTYELCWIHLILQVGLSLFIGGGMYKFVRGFF